MAEILRPRAVNLAAGSSVDRRVAKLLQERDEEIATLRLALCVLTMRLGGRAVIVGEDFDEAMASTMRLGLHPNDKEIFIIETRSKEETGAEPEAEEEGASDGAQVQCTDQDGQEG